MIWRRISAYKLLLRSYATVQPEILDVARIRNVGISAHIDSGKTTLTERILFYTGRLAEMHEVKGKDSVGAKMDFMELERQRGITIQSAATYSTWKGVNINIIDTPGHVDFTIEVERALRVLDGAILVLCAVGGVQSQTYTVTRQMKRYNVPHIAFINKLDRLYADHNRVLKQIRSKLGLNAALLQIPIGLEAKNEAIIDLLSERALYFEAPQGINIVERDIPEHMRAETKARRQELIECVADGDEILGEKFLNEESISTSDVHAAIRRACLAHTFTPILCGTALKNRGVQPLLDAAISYLPNPSEVTNHANVLATGDEATDAKIAGVDRPITKIVLDPSRPGLPKTPFVCLAFKLEAGKFGQLTYMRVYQGDMKRGDSLYNVRTGKRVKISRMARMHADEMEEIGEAHAGDIVAFFGVDCATGDSFTNVKDYEISCESMFVPEPVVSMSIKPDKRDNEAFGKGLQRFAREDPTFRIRHDEESKEIIVSGMGELHLEIYAQRLEREYKAPCKLGKPRVAFRETITSTFEYDYWHRKQTGGRGEYARVIGIIEPLDLADCNRVDFSDETIGTNVPKTFVGSIKKGVLEACQEGPLIGHPVTGIRFRLIDGAHHIVDSSDWAFQQAARYAMRQAYDEARWQILEPVMSVETTAPAENQGAIMSVLSRRGAIITATDATEEFFSVITEVPMNNMFGYVADLRGVTQGKGEFTMEFSKYCPAMGDVQEKLIKDYEEAMGRADEAKKKGKA